MAFYMEKMTVLEMKQAMEQTKTVIIPIGVTEQHGYHLPLSTDIKNAVLPTQAAGDRLNAVVAPSVNYSFSGGELLGTVNVSSNTVALYISEIVSEFIRMGFENVICFLGHGGMDNDSAFRHSLQTLLRRNHDIAEKVTISLFGSWDLSPTWVEGFSMKPEPDFHAGMMETAIIMNWSPEDVRDEIIMDEPEIARLIRTPGWFDKKTKPIDHPFIIETARQREEIKVGIGGFPERATKELGEKICNEIVDGLVAYVDMLEEHRKNK